MDHVIIVLILFCLNQVIFLFFCFFLRNKMVTLTKAECTVSEFIRKNTIVSVKVYFIRKKYLFSQ